MRPGRLLACLALTNLVGHAAHSEPSAKVLSQFTRSSWSAKDGIPGPIHAIAQTSDGYLWLGTDAGLYRFDGLRFEVIDPGGKEEPHGAAVLSLLAARDGSLWIGTESAGVGRLDGGRFVAYPPDGAVPEGTILSIAEDQAGSVWIAGPYGLACYQDGRWRRIGPESGYPARGAQWLLVDRSGTLWVATDGFNFGLSDNQMEPNTFLALPKDATRFAPTGLAVSAVAGMSESRDGGVWAADMPRSVVRRIGGGSPVSLTVEHPASLAFGADGSLWIGVVSGGFRRARRPESGDPLDELILRDDPASNTPWAAFNDREGNLWFGTGGSLEQFRDSKLTPYSGAEGLAPDLDIALAATPDGSLWLFGYAEHGVVRRRAGGPFVGTAFPPYTPTDTSRVLAMSVSPSGHLWVAGSFGVAREDDGRFTFSPVPSGLPPRPNIEAVAEDRDGGLWATMSSHEIAGQVMRRRNGVWTNLTAESKLPSFRCRILHADAAGRMWIGYEHGELVVFDGESARSFSAKDGLAGGRILAVAEDRRGRIWVGSEGGLSRFDGDRFVALRKGRGLPGTAVSAIVEDGEGKLWIAGSLGILRVAPEELERALAEPSHRLEGVTFDATDGMRGLPAMGEPFPTAARTADGRLWFSTTGGIAVIDPRGWPQNALPPPVTIDRVVADGRVLALPAELRLPSQTRGIEIHYAALSLTAPERVRFRYRLEGYDRDWHGPLDVRTATYTNLPPRSYRFHVVACNDDGVWNETGATLDFVIDPAFHQTWAFIFLCAAAAAGLAGLAYRARVRQLRSRLQLQFRERLEERTRIARELHDTLLQGIMSASMQLHVAVDRVSEDSPARPLFARVLELMRGVIDEGRNAVQGLRAVDADREDLERAFSHLREEIAAPAGIDYRVVGMGRARPLDPVIRDEIYRIGREAVVNAFRHAGARLIEVQVELGSRRLRVAVRDDGRGIDPELAENGREGHFGLIGMRERAKRIGGRLQLGSRARGGTEVELSVPAAIAFRPKSRRPEARP